MADIVESSQEGYNKDLGVFYTEFVTTRLISFTRSFVVSLPAVCGGYRCIICKIGKKLRSQWNVRNTEQQVTHLLSLNSIVAENDPWILKGVFLEEPIFQRFWMKKQALHGLNSELIISIHTSCTLYKSDAQKTLVILNSKSHICCLSIPLWLKMILG